MTHRNIKPSMAMTAIAAVIALSSTPSLAQDASVPEPVIDSTPVTTTSDPLAPEPVTTTVDTPAPEATAETTAKKPSVAKAAPVRRSASATRSSGNRTASSAPAAPATPVAAPAADAPAEIPVPIAAEAPPIAEPVAPPAAEVAPVAQNDAIEDALPIAGAAGLGLLALAGFGLAARRRRRRREDEEFEATQWALAHAEPEPEPQPAAVAAEPAFVRPAASPDPALADSPVTALPAGFDISKFGRHVQAAYRGPTPDNPSLSLKNRLRRASFFDQQERREAEETKTSPKPAAQPAWAARKPNEAEFMFRPARKPAAKPAFQH